MGTYLFVGLFAVLALLPLMATKLPVGGAVSGLTILFRKIVSICFWVSATAGLMIAFVQLAALVTRNVFGVNFIWLQESALYLFAVMFLLSTGAILLADGHVRVDVFYGKWGARRQKLIDLFGLYFFVFPIAALVMVAAAPYVVASWATMEGSADPGGIQAVFLLKTLIPIFGAILAMGTFVRVQDVLTGYRPGGDHGHVG